MRLDPLFAGALLLSGLASSCSSFRPAAEPGVRKPAPDFVLSDREGRPARLSDYRSHVVVLNFWATWCVPCRIEMPWLANLERQHKRDGLAVIGISQDEKGWLAVVPFLEELNINYLVVMGNDQVALLYGGAKPLPSTFLIDRDGKIAAAYAGVVNRKAFEDQVERLLQPAALVAPQKTF